MGSKWEALDDRALLQEAASVIEKLKILNEDLRKEASEALRESRELSAGLVVLRSELAESERMRRELVEALRISEELWRNYKREGWEKIIRGDLIGAGIVGIVGIMAAIGIGFIKL